MFAEQSLTKLVGVLNMMMQNYANTYYPAKTLKLSAELFMP